MNRVIGIIAANYATEKLGRLTEERTIASLPYGGRYRMIDFALSNMVNSGIDTVGVITPYKYRSILDHVGAGKAWGLDRKRGGLFILPGSVYGVAQADFALTLRDLRRNLVYLMRSPAEYVLLTSVSVVCNMDYRALLQRHIETGADLTVAYNIADAADPAQMAFQMDGERVTSLRRGVEAGDRAFLDCFVISRALLLRMLDWYKAVDYLDFFEALTGDLEKYRICAMRFDGYARSIQNLQEYFRYSMDLLDTRVSDELFSEEAPIMTKMQDSPPTKYLHDARVQNSLIPAGCVIEGTVEGSILFRGVKVGRGAVVKNSIIMQSCVLEEGACVENAMIDRGNVIAAGTVIRGTAGAAFVKEKAPTVTEITRGGLRVHEKNA